MRTPLAIAISTIIGIASWATYRQTDTNLIGKLPDGATRIVTGWKIKPAGTSILLPDMLQRAALAPDGKTLAVISGGAGVHEIHLIEPQGGTLRQSIPLGRAQSIGLAWTADSKNIFIAGGNSGRVHRVRVNDDLRGADPDAITLPGTSTFQSGLAVSPTGDVVYVADISGNRIHRIVFATTTFTTIDLPTNARPGAMTLSPDGKSLRVCLWGGAAIVSYDATTLAETARFAVDQHPNDIIERNGDIWVSCGNADTVVRIDAKSGAVTERIRTKLIPTALTGSTPSALSLSTDGKRLAVALSDANAVQLIDVEKPGMSETIGFVPTAAYPTAVAFSANGKTLFIGSGKGLGTGPNPGKSAVETDELKGRARRQAGLQGRLYPYIATLLKGVVQTVDISDAAQLKAYTATVLQNSPYGTPPAAVDPASTVIPTKAGVASPIKYVIYVIKENRTYDQVFGNLPKGNGDPDLCIFGDDIAPNHRALAQQYVLFDNLYANGEVSVDGHHWSNGAFVPDSMQRTWPAQYGSKGAPPIRYGDFNDPLSTNPSGRIWDMAAAKGLDYRTYYYHTTKKTNVAWNQARGKGERDYVAIDIFLKDYAEFEASGKMPSLMVMALSEDHTKGATAGANTPAACVASNDYALGKLVEAVSKSKYWKETAIMVIEDDAQNGPDHVDAHRTVALAISPYTRRGILDSTFYNTTSILRTIELLLGLDPMSPFDATATPMYKAFGSKADITPYTAIKPATDIDAKNPPKTALLKLQGKIDFSAPDRMDVAGEQRLNRVLWHSIKGLRTPYPGITRSPLFSRDGKASIVAGDDSEERD